DRQPEPLMAIGGPGPASPGPEDRGYLERFVHAYPVYWLPCRHSSASTSSYFAATAMNASPQPLPRLTSCSGPVGTNSPETFTLSGKAPLRRVLINSTMSRFA